MKVLTQGMAYREQKVNAAAFSEFIASVFSVIPVSHCCLCLPAQIFPFVLFFPSLPYEYSFRILKSVMQILISCLDHAKRKNNHPAKTTNNKTTAPPPKIPKDPPLCGYLILPKKKSYKSTMKNQWAGFVHMKISRVMPVYKRRQCRC